MFEDTSCKRFWRAVITVAVMDAMYCKTVYRWFDVSNDDFITICGFADVLPSKVIEYQRMKYASYRHSSYERAITLRLIRDTLQEIMNDLPGMV